MLLKMNVRNAYFRSCGTAGVVTAYLDVVGVDTGEILEVISIGNICFQSNFIEAEEDVVVSIAVFAEAVAFLELDCHSGMVFCRCECDAEVVVLVGRGCDVCPKVNLTLPLVAAYACGHNE